MKKILGFLIFAGFFVSCSTSKNATVTETKEEVETVASELTPELAAGKAVFENKCGRCHDLPLPSNYSKEKWKPIMDSMAKKSKLSDEQKDLVYQYVTMNL